jgi:ATP synthase protein I
MNARAALLDPSSGATDRSKPDPLIYSPRVNGAPVNDLGRASVYLALFSEIAIVLLVTTLVGVLAGNWLDQRLGTLPILSVMGMLVGFGLGGLGVYRLIVRFLDRLDKTD